MIRKRLIDDYHLSVQFILFSLNSQVIKNSHHLFEDRCDIERLVHPDRSHSLYSTKKTSTKSIMAKDFLYVAYLVIEYL